MILFSVSLTATRARRAGRANPKHNAGAGKQSPPRHGFKNAPSRDQESQRAIYRWHDAEHPSPPTWFDKLLVKIAQYRARLECVLGFCSQTVAPRIEHVAETKSSGWHQGPSISAAPPI
jgi:hypothetical protein